MAICRMCHKSIPEGRDFCDECESKRQNQADESYLDSLLNSVSFDVAPSPAAVPRKAPAAEPVKKSEPSLNDSSAEDIPEVVPEVIPEDVPEVVPADNSDMDELLSDLLSNMDDLPSSGDEEPTETLEADDISDIFNAAEAASMEEDITGLDPDLVSVDEPDSEATEEQQEEASDTIEEAVEEAVEESVEEPTEESADEPELETVDLDEIPGIEVADSDSSVDALDAIDPFSDTEPVPADVGQSSPDFLTEEDLENSELEGDNPETVDDPFSGDEDFDVNQVIDDIESGEFEKEINKLAPDKKALNIEDKPEKKKKSLFERLFYNIKEERTPEQEQAYREKLEAEAKAKQEKEELKKQRAAESKEQKAERKKEAKEEKEKLAKEKAEQKRQQKAEAAEARKKKKEEKLALEEIEVDEGRINRAGASILFVFFAILTVLIIVGTNIYSYNLSIKNAQKEFDIKHYNDAYYEVYGLDIKDEDIELYDRIMTVMYVNTQLNSYQYYMTSGSREKALDSLLKGLQRYDKYYQLATILDIRDDLNYVKSNILDELDKEFGYTEEQAYSMISISNEIDYSEYIYSLLGTYEVNGLE